MRSGASNLKWWLSLAVIACITLTGGLASAQNAQGLAAVGAIDPANGFPRWYMDKNGLQLGQCLDTSVIDPCAVIPELPDPTQPVIFNTNFPRSSSTGARSPRLTTSAASEAGASWC